MTLALVGGAGYIGTRLAQLATSRGHHAVVVARRPAPEQLAWRQFLDHLEPAHTRPFTVVWLLAGDRHNEPAHLLQFLEVAPAGRARVVYASSCAVYGRATKPATEHGPTHPQGPYAHTKAACEQMVTAAGLPVCVLRLATVHGHDHAGEPKQAVHRILHQAATGHIEIYGAANWRPFIHRDTAAAALLDAALDPSLTGTINVAEEHATFAGVGRYAAQLLDAEITYSNRPDPRSYLVDTTKAHQLRLPNTAHPTGTLATSMRHYAAAIQQRPAVTT